MEVARDGELAEPRVPAPAGVRTVLGFSRLSAAAYAIVRRAVDEDEAFRERVAAAADEGGESGVGRAGWLWLHRPDGWEADPAVAAGAMDEHDAGRGVARLRRERDGAEAAAARYRQAAETAEEARRRAVEQLTEARRDAVAARAELAALRAEVADLGEDRNRAVRAQKALEADLADARRDRNLAREATRQAEADLAALRSSSGARPTAEPVDRTAARAAVATAAEAAAVLARSLDDAAAALGDPGVAGRATRTGRGRRDRAVRARPSLPPGVFDGTADAHRHLVTAGEALLLVDGYNLAREAWADVAPEEERRRTVALLEEVGARSGAAVTVVFDGADDTVAPAASRAVRVRFSAGGQTADQAIAALLAELPAGQPVVVVSSDREVADDARRQGAVALGSAAFLAAVGR